MTPWRIFSSFISVVLLVGISWAIVHVSSSGEATTSKVSSDSIPIPGGLLFDSDVSGTFGLYFLDFKTGDWHVVLDDELHNQQPTLHVPTKTILFTLGESSERNAASDIASLSLETGEVNTLYENAGSPVPFGDESKFVFNRDNRKAFIGDIGGSKPSLLFPTRRFPKFRGQSVIKPSLSSDQTTLTFISNVPKRWTVWTLSLEDGKKKSFVKSCQPSWNKAGDKIIFVSERESPGGRTGLWEYTPGGSAERIIDAPDPLGTEYFPTFGPNEVKFYGACPSDQKSHNRANYELMYKRPSEPRVALTSNGKTNRWPHYVSDNDALALLRQFPRVRE